MKAVTFIIATPSYPVNKGLSLILNGIRNAKVLEITESADDLTIRLKQLQPDYLIIADTLMEKFDEKRINSIFKSSSETQIIRLIGDNSSGKRKGFFTDFPINSGKKESSDFFINLVEKETITENDTENDISNREKTILRLVAMGKTNKEIADELFLSIHTVITHRKNITKKLGIKSISGLTIYALINGIISMEDVEP